MGPASAVKTWLEKNWCAVDDCKNKTNGEFPWCAEHIDAAMDVLFQAAIKGAQGLVLSQREADMSVEELALAYENGVITYEKYQELLRELKLDS